MAADWKNLTYLLAEQYYGPPDPARSSRKVWKWAGRGGFQINRETGQWYCFTDQRGGSAIALVQYHEGVDRPAAVQWLKDRGFLNEATDSRPPSPATPPRNRQGRNPDRQPKTDDHRKTARKVWTAATAVPEHPEHPARLWLAKRNLWRPDCPLPAAVRWRPFTRRQLGGAIVAAFAPPEAWTAAWPGSLDSTAISSVECVFVGPEGDPTADRPVADGGLHKRSYGSRHGAYCLLGGPDLSEGIAVAEGLADALALAARLPEAVVCVGGTGGMAQPELTKWLKGAASVAIYCDNDEPGGQSAHNLRLALELAGCSLAQVLSVANGKDPADAAIHSPFTILEQTLLKTEAERNMVDGLPIEEAYRRAAQVLT